MLEYNEGEWTIIVESPVYQEQIKPWLRHELENAIESGLNDESPGREYWLGCRNALKMVLERPERELTAIAQEAAKAAEAKREENKNAGKVRVGTGFLRRLRPNWWDPEPSGK